MGNEVITDSSAGLNCGCQCSFRQRIWLEPERKAMLRLGMLEVDSINVSRLYQLGH